MTKAEAQEALRQGKKITHRYFSEDEFIYMDDQNDLKDEKDIILNWFDFWSYREDSWFDYGWEIYL